MQILSTTGEENGNHTGLSLIKGGVKKIDTKKFTTCRMELSNDKKKSNC